MLLSSNQSDLKNCLNVCKEENPDPLRLFNFCLYVWQGG